MPKQSFLPGFDGLKVKEFGGSKLKGNAREARPISTKRPIHLVMRSSLAIKERSFLYKKRAKRIEQVVYGVAKATNVRVYRMANAGNHLHILILPASRDGFNAYIRAISGIIARLSLGVERGRALGMKFWDARPYTRIVDWGRAFKAVCDYVALNSLEAIGFVPDAPVRRRATPRVIPKAVPLGQGLR